MEKERSFYVLDSEIQRTNPIIYKGSERRCSDVRLDVTMLEIFSRICCILGSTRRKITRYCLWPLDTERRPRTVLTYCFLAVACG